jgi:hypothetical protein
MVAIVLKGTEAVVPGPQRRPSVTHGKAASDGNAVVVARSKALSAAAAEALFNRGAMVSSAGSAPMDAFALAFVPEDGSTRPALLVGYHRLSEATGRLYDQTQVIQLTPADSPQTWSLALARDATRPEVAPRLDDDLAAPDLPRAERDALLARGFDAIRSRLHRDVFRQLLANLAQRVTIVFELPWPEDAAEALFAWMACLPPSRARRTGFACGFATPRFGLGLVLADREHGAGDHVLINLNVAGLRDRPSVYADVVARWVYDERASAQVLETRLAGIEAWLDDAKDELDGATWLWESARQWPSQTPAERAQQLTEPRLPAHVSLRFCCWLLTSAADSLVESPELLPAVSGWLSGDTTAATARARSMLTSATPALSGDGAIRLLSAWASVRDALPAAVIDVLARELLPRAVDELTRRAPIEAVIAASAVCRCWHDDVSRLAFATMARLEVAERSIAARCVAIALMGGHADPSALRAACLAAGVGDPLELLDEAGLLRADTISRWSVAGGVDERLLLLERAVGRFGALDEAARAGLLEAVPSASTRGDDEAARALGAASALLTPPSAWSAPAAIAIEKLVRGMSVDALAAQLATDPAARRALTQAADLVESARASEGRSFLRWTLALADATGHRPTARGAQLALLVEALVADTPEALRASLADTIRWWFDGFGRLFSVAQSEAVGVSLGRLAPSASGARPADLDLDRLTWPPALPRGDSSVAGAARHEGTSEAYDLLLAADHAPQVQAGDDVADRDARDSAGRRAQRHSPEAGADAHPASADGPRAVDVAPERARLDLRRTAPHLLILLIVVIMLAVDDRCANRTAPHPTDTFSRTQSDGEEPRPNGSASAAAPTTAPPTASSQVR